MGTEARNGPNGCVSWSMTRGDRGMHQPVQNQTILPIVSDLQTKGCVATGLAQNGMKATPGDRWPGAKSVTMTGRRGLQLGPLQRVLVQIVAGH